MKMLANFIVFFGLFVGVVLGYGSGSAEKGYVTILTYGMLGLVAGIIVGGFVRDLSPE